MNKRGKAQKTFDDVYECLLDRLNVIGPITTREAFELTTGRVRTGRILAGYQCITDNFRVIMDTMVEQRKAEKVDRGIWEIRKPNHKNETPLSNAAPGGGVHAVHDTAQFAHHT